MIEFSRLSFLTFAFLLLTYQSNFKSKPKPLNS
jgi:hypothetical protein